MKSKTITMTRIIIGTLLVILCLFSLNTQAQAIPIESEQQQVQINYQEPKEAETPNVFWTIVQTVLALCLILALAWGMIRLFGGHMRSRLQGRYLRVLDEVTLGPNRGMAVVEVGGKAFIVGVTDHQISMLGELNDSQIIQEMIAASLENTPVSPANPVTFWKYIKDRLFTRLPPKSSDQGFDAIVDQKMQALDKMSYRLRNLNNSNQKDNGWNNEGM
ncbi:MAG: flagellar biosynthetic protein FliO [Syntrophomonadales bacterium]|jgi:flagellar protein FliO/FliZ